MKKLIVAMMFAVCPILSAYAQGSPDTNMEILRAKMQADKKLVVAAAMNLNDEQGKKFWPIYDDHQAGLDKINKRTGELITQYAKAYNAGEGALKDGEAKKLLDDSLKLDEDEVKLRKSTAAKVSKALSPVYAARYIQVENKIRAIIRYEAAAKIPLAGISDAK